MPTIKQIHGNLEQRFNAASEADKMILGRVAALLGPPLADSDVEPLPGYILNGSLSSLEAYLQTRHEACRKCGACTENLGRAEAKAEQNAIIREGESNAAPTVWFELQFCVLKFGIFEVKGDDQVFKPGVIPDASMHLDTNPLTAEAVPGHGPASLLEWVGREEAQKECNVIISSIYQHWKRCGIDRTTRLELQDKAIQPGMLISEDNWKRGCKRTAIIGQPGCGRTNMAQLMVPNAADQVDNPRLRKMLQRCKEYKLQYLIDMSRDQRIAEEENAYFIRPAQAYALRILYMMCRKTIDGNEETYEEFMKSLMSCSEVNDVALLLTDMEARHVTAVARKELLEGCEEPVVFHFILEEFQAGVEAEEADQQAANSVCRWCQSMLASAGSDLQLEDDLVLTTCSGTIMGLPPIQRLAGSEGLAGTGIIPLRLLQEGGSTQSASAPQYYMLAGFY